MNEDSSKTATLHKIRSPVVSSSITLQFLLDFQQDNNK